MADQEELVWEDEEDIKPEDSQLTETVKPSHRAKKRKNKKSPEEKAYQAVEKHIIRNEMIRIEEGLWKEHSDYAFECHLYITSTSTSDPALGGNSLGLLSYYIPDKVRIINKVLKSEMEEITGVNDLWEHLVPPFRSIIPFEKQFRALYQSKAAEFKEIALQYPQHKSVLRPERSLPHALVAFLKIRERYSIWQDIKIDSIDKARFLLDGLRDLISFFDTYLSHLIECYRNMQAGTIDSIPFAYLWHLFSPGQEIVTAKPNYQVYRVLNITGAYTSLAPREGNTTPRTIVTDLTIDCFSLDFDGKACRPISHKIIISPYDGLLEITSLAAYPLKYESGFLEQRLIQRGEKFAELAMITHRRYTGLSLKEGDTYSRIEEIDSDVVIDFELAFRNSEPRFEPPEFSETAILNLHSETSIREAREARTYSAEEKVNMFKWFEFKRTTNLIKPQSLGSRERDVMILLPYRVYGYVLLSRRWYPLDIDSVGPAIDRNQDRFEKLILPMGHKDIVQALIQTHARTSRNEQSKDREFDVVKGKGKGLIILLHGAPGVGKTSTAECVAISTGRPLFPINCGDISGSTAQDVERNLERYFDLARKWGCILLLDEADIFLSERTKGNIMQNSLVSVFLRVLEYYSGILVLTTNRIGSLITSKRIGDFDEAVRSRVSCAFYFPPLSKRNTLDVWKMNIDMLKDQNRELISKLPIQFDPKEIKQFARDHWREGNRWNGRQIKNAFQTAAALAEWDHIKAKSETPKLTREHFKTVAAASAHFDKYLSAVRKTDQFRAKTNEVRRDDLENDIQGDSSRSYEGNLLQTSRISMPEWPGASESESTTDTSESEATEDESEPFKKKNSENLVPPNDMKSKQEEVKRNAQDGSSKSKSSREKSSKQESGQFSSAESSQSDSETE